MLNMNFAALNGETVTEGHVKACQIKGHATYVKDGVVQEYCPRCDEKLPVKTYEDYLNTLTVKVLREIAAQLEIKGRSGLKKDALVCVVAGLVEDDYMEALHINDSWRKVKTASITPFKGDIVIMDDPSIAGEITDIKVFPDMIVYQVTSLNGSKFAREGFDMRYADVDTAYEFRQDKEILAGAPMTFVCENCDKEILTAEHVSHKEACDKTFVLRSHLDNSVLTIFTDPDSVAILKAHDKAIRRFNPTMARDKSGSVILTAAQRRRVQKANLKLGRKLGFLTPKKTKEYVAN